MKNKNLIVFILLIPFMVTSCGKDDNCKAGKGGNLTIMAYPEHHGKTIYNQPAYADTVFVKYDSQSLPGLTPSDYDTYFKGETGEDHVHMSGLSCGKYYFYAVGWDSSINQRVTGGIPYSTDETSGEIKIKIPVTE